MSFEDLVTEAVDLRTARLRTEFFDVGAVVYFLRKVIWMVPGSPSTPTTLGSANYTRSSPRKARSSRTRRAS